MGRREVGVGEREGIEMTTNVPMSELPVWMLLVIAVLAVVQVSLAIFALIRLFKTPDDRLVFGKKWPWLVIILFVNLIGAVLFLAVGRKPSAAVDPLAARASDAPRTDRAERAADVLYGSRDGE